MLTGILTFDFMTCVNEVQGVWSQRADAIDLLQVTVHLLEHIAHIAHVILLEMTRRGGQNGVCLNMT